MATSRRRSCPALRSVTPEPIAIFLPSGAKATVQMWMFGASNRAACGQGAAAGWSGVSSCEAPRTSQPARPFAQIADESPRKLTRYDTWLDPDLLLSEEKTERGVQVTAPTVPADPVRGAFGELISEQFRLTGPSTFGPFPSFVGVRVGS